MGSRCCKKQKVLDEEDDKPESAALDVNAPAVVKCVTDQALKQEASHEKEKERKGKEEKDGIEEEGEERGKEGNEGKERKEGQEGKEENKEKQGKEEKEGKERKEGKEGKQEKEGTQGKEGKQEKEGKEMKEEKERKETKEVKEGEMIEGALLLEQSSPPPTLASPPEAKIKPENTPDTVKQKPLQSMENKERQFILPEEGKYELLPPTPSQCVGLISDEHDKGDSAFIFEVPRVVGMAVVDKMIRYPKLNRLHKDCTGEVFSNTHKGNETVAFCIKSPRNSHEDMLCAAKTFIAVDMPMLQNHLLNLEHDIFDKSMTREEQRAMLEKGRFAFFPEKPIWEKYSKCLLLANKKRLLKLTMR